jgi:hypothetical protein
VSINCVRGPFLAPPTILAGAWQAAIRKSPNVAHPRKADWIIQQQREALIQRYTDEVMSQGRLEIADQILADGAEFFAIPSSVKALTP